LGGVYKLVEVDGLPKLKVTSDMAKATLPGTKSLLRATGPDGVFIQDVICLEGDAVQPGETVYDPTNPLQHKFLPMGARLSDLRRVVMEEGQRTAAKEPLESMTTRCRRELALLPQGCLRFINPHRYKVSVSPRLNELRCRLITEASTREA
jgi:nicotinate phosphoribosyltransferase